MNSRIKSLCKRAKRADKGAACELLTFYYSDVYAYLRRLCGSNQDAEDLTQQTFLKVWSSLSNFAGRSKLSTWLFRIAYNTYIDWQRGKAANTLHYPDPWWNECPDTNPGPLTNVADRQWAQQLYEAVDRLDENKKHVVHLHYYQGLSIRQTAKVLNVATSTVKYRLREVFKILRTQIDIEESGMNPKAMPVPQGERI